MVRLYRAHYTKAKRRVCGMTTAKRDALNVATQYEQFHFLSGQNALLGKEFCSRQEWHGTAISSHLLR